MKLLFVDPEPRVPQAFARVLGELEPEWEIRAARSTREALATLNQYPCDVVITELYGDELDGAALLARVARARPSVARFVLSGHPAHEVPQELLRVAHQLLPKPCAAETLHRILVRLQQLAELLPERKWRSLAAEAALLPSPPEVLERALATLGAPRAAGELGRILRVDPALTAKLLQLASSGFVCGSSKVADVDSALQQLGLHWVERVVRSLSATVAPSNERASTVATLRAGQLRAHDIARVAASLARLPEDAAAAYLAGLLCNVGQLLLEQAAPERLHATRSEAAQCELPEHLVERATWGTTHAELGAYLLGLWGLPFKIVEAVAHHHAPERASGDSASLTQLVWIAANVVEGVTPSADQLARFNAEELYRYAQSNLSALRPPP